MDSAQRQKLKELVQRSEILNDHERKEWTALLELMNDKQMYELEKILMSNQKQPAVNAPVKSMEMASKPAFLAIRPPMPKAAQAAKPETIQPSKPLLSHIMNLPKPMAKGAVPLPKPAAKTHSGTVDLNPKFKVSPLAPPLKVKFGFMARLKKLVQEKKLPPGHPAGELELPAAGGTLPAPPKPIKQAMPIRPPAPLKTEPKPEEKKPEQVVININLSKENEKVELEFGSRGSGLSLNVSGPSKQGASAWPRPRLTTPVANTQGAPAKNGALKPLETAETQEQQAQNTPPPAESKFSDPGLKIESETGRSQQEIVAAIKSGMQPSRAKPSGAALEAISRLKINSLEDLSLLNMPQVEVLEAEEFVAKIKNLIAQFGYFDAIFQLEKSPAYKDYLNTGLKLLETKGSFENLAQGGAGKTISKRQFEGFADLLRKIQAA